MPALTSNRMNGEARTAHFNPEPTSIHRISKDVDDREHRLDYGIDAVAESISPVARPTPESRNLNGTQTVSPLDLLTVMHVTGSELEAATTKGCQPADVADSFQLMVSFQHAWTLTLRRSHVQLRPGDLILADSRNFQAGPSPPDCLVVTIKIPPVWAAAWLQRPELLAGNVIAHDVGWGRALSTFVAQITPQSVARASLPPRLIAQNLGSLLSLVEAELVGQQIPSHPRERQTEKLVCDLIRQRACEPGLTASDVALALGVSERTLHRAMASAGRTFGKVLQKHRIELAKRMLEAHNFDRLTTAEIGFRAGFADPSYFVRAATRHLGQTPARYRAASRK